jgi:hypothetical protein
MADVTTNLTKKLDAISSGLPPTPTNAQNGKALKALIQLIRDMEVARVNSLVDGPSAVAVIKE